MNELIELIILDNLKQAVKRYGIEGTEQKIQQLYVAVPKMQEKMLEVFNKYYKGKRHDSTNY